LKERDSTIHPMKTNKSSEISKFYKKTLSERQSTIHEWTQNDSTFSILETGLQIEQASNMIENAIGIYGLPLGIATNFLINGKDYLIPMAIEEPSVVAAASNAAKLAREGGGFTTRSNESVMIGQIQVLDLPDIRDALSKLEENKSALISKANETGGSIVRRGGGARDLIFRILKHELTGKMIIIHLLFDVQDAMGANAVNTAVEYIADDITRITGGRVNLKILSNLSDQRKAYAQCTVPRQLLPSNTAERIVEANIFAEIDPYRATTHNKGIMNGIDAVVIATGNDWRAVEAGAHAFAARGGSYTSLTQWRQNETGDLVGSIELPLAVGIVGGATRVHPTAQLALQILGVDSARELAEVMAAVGLAQNLAAIRALATEGIQQGHMRMHARQLALAAGASPEKVSAIVEQLILEGNIRLERAKALVEEYQGE
jgi:hydroxymethylglutaryl-CoA reductase